MIDDFRIDDACDELRDWRQRPLAGDTLTTVAVHRTIFTPGDARAIARMFQHSPEIAQYTGAENPYHVIIEPSGNAVQCLPMNERGAHARRWNVEALGVAVAWDTLSAPMPAAMWLSLIRVCRLLCLYAGIEDIAEGLHGHDELRGGSSDPDKQCPGPHVPMDQLRIATAAHKLVDGTGVHDWLACVDGARRQQIIEDSGLRLSHGL